jgi:hypothetical protein
MRNFRFPTIWFPIRGVPCVLWNVERKEWVHSRQVAEAPCQKRNIEILIF